MIFIPHRGPSQSKLTSNVWLFRQFQGLQDQACIDRDLAVVDREPKHYSVDPTQEHQTAKEKVNQIILFNAVSTRQARADLVFPRMSKHSLKFEPAVPGCGHLTSCWIRACC